MKIKVLLVNYSEDAQKLYLPLLARHGVTAHCARNMPDALVMMVEADYSGIAINGDYLEYLPLLKVMRKLTTIPIGVSVSRYSQEENHDAVERGADIYRVRYDGAERRAERFASLVKIYVEYTNGQQKPMTVITHGEIQVFPHTRKVYVKGMEARLLGKEFDILHFLMLNKGLVLSHEQIFLHVWGEDYDDNVKERLWNHVSRLRSKLQSDTELHEYIVTERNVGYSFNPRMKSG